MEKIKAQIGYEARNFCCGWADEELGIVVAVTGKSIEEVKAGFSESLALTLEGCKEDGDKLPEYLEKGNYEIVYEVDTAALLHHAEAFTTLSAISRVSGINQKQLSHYATGVKVPRAPQRERILRGLREIGRMLSIF